MSRQLTLTVLDRDAGAERLDELSSALRRELLDLGVDDVERMSDGEPPPGTRAVDAAAVGVLLVAFQESLPVIAGIVGVVRAWLGSARGSRAVEITIGDQTLKIDSASRPQQDRLIEEFVAALRRAEEPRTPMSAPAP